MRNAYRIVLGKPERKRVLWTSRHEWEDNIKVFVKVIICESMYWVCLAQDRVNCSALVSKVLKYRIHRRQPADRSLFSQ
jgi:hypothetical protein